MPHNVDLIWRIFYEHQQLTVVVVKNATTDSASSFPDSETLRMCLEMADLLRWNSSAIFWLAVMVFIMIPSAGKCARNVFAPSDRSIAESVPQELPQSEMYYAFMVAPFDKRRH